MVEDQLKSRRIRDERLLSVMREIPRHRFVPPDLAPRAYEDGPLPIGEGQTISQPYIVAEMTEALHLSGNEKVLFRVGDGTLGAPEDAPFDRVIVTAAAPHVPEPLFAQMREGGIMVIPMGGRWEQDLVRVHKEQGAPRKEYLGGCRFVPLLGEHGFSA